MTGVLTGVRVVDWLGDIRARCQCRARGLGADVIKVESVVGGDPGRALMVGACSLPSNAVG